MGTTRNTKQDSSFQKNECNTGQSGCNVKNHTAMFRLQLGFKIKKAMRIFITFFC